jgi:UDP-3-O-[3-hydroxymyristoyl] N-acetylglucosamine deacetylase
VKNLTLCTVLGDDTGVTISTVEHLLAALSAFAVTGAEIAVTGPEVPILDGSAAKVVQALRCTGLRRLPGERATLTFSGPVWLEDGASSMLALPADTFRVTAAAAYAHPLIGRQVVDFAVAAEIFEHEIAAARTFGFEHELEELSRRGLALGGSLDNALVFMEDGSAGPMRFPDEPVRHKALDVIGDLALLGALPLAHIIAVRPSHRLIVEFARLLQQHGTRGEDAGKLAATAASPPRGSRQGDCT